MARKGKSDGGGKKEKRAKRKDVYARSAGALVGLLMLGFAGWQLVTGVTDIAGAGRIAVAALVSALVVEKVVVPFGRLVIGPPGGDDA